MTPHDLDLYAPYDNAGEGQARVCLRCRWYEPCPCGRCGYGMCTRPLGDREYVSEEVQCDEWEES